MEPERYTQYLPAELTWDVFLRLGWRELYELYTGLDEYRDYDDPDIPIWRMLYHRDLSSYPLPDDADYRQQYFWGQALVDSLDESPAKIQDSVVTLIDLGYDIPLRRFLPLLPTGPHIAPKRDFLNTAIEGGYLSIVEMLYPLSGASYSILSLTQHAAMHERMDVLNYLLDRLTSDHLGQLGYLLATIARNTGNVEIFDRVFEFVKSAGLDLEYCDHMQMALAAPKADLVAKMLDRCDPLTDSQLLNSLDLVEHLSVLYFMMDYLKERSLITGLGDIPADVILEVATRDCDLEHIMYATERGARFSWGKYYNIAKCTDPDVHRWMVENRPQREYLEFVVDTFNLHPELVDVYLDGLSEKVPTQLTSDLLMWAITRNKGDMVHRILNHPYLPLTPKQLKWFRDNYPIVNNYRDMTNKTQRR